MAYVWIDRTVDNQFKVRIMRGLRGDTTRTFRTHAEAKSFAQKRMGKTGMVVDRTALRAPLRTTSMGGC